MKKILLLVSLFAGSFSFANQLPSSAETGSETVPKIEEVNQTQSSGSRDYILYFANGLSYILNQKFQPTSGASRNDIGYNLNIKAARNLGSVEVGPVFQSSYYEFGSSDDSVKSQYYGLFAQYNFIPNQIGHKWIPFVAAELLVGDTTEVDNGVEISQSYLKTYLSGGVEYFPVNDYLSIVFGLTSSQRKYDIAKSSQDYSYSGLDLLVDFKVYF